MFARAGTAGFAVFVLLLGLARVIPFFHGALFFVSLVLVFGAVAFVVLLDRRIVTVDEHGVTVDEFLGRLPARTIPYDKIGRAEIETAVPLPGKTRRPRRAPGSTLHISTPDRNGRSGSDILAVALPEDVDGQALLDELRSYGVDADAADGSRLRRSMIPTPIALIVFPIAIAVTAYWSATRPESRAVHRPPAIMCATLEAGGTVDLRVANFIPVSITLTGFNSSEPVVSVGTLGIEPPQDLRKPGDTKVTFRASGLVPKHLYALTLNSAAGPAMVPFLSVPSRHQGMGC